MSSEKSLETLEGASREKICRVCGDKALGYNFNAITCESCKAFFRRNALKNKEFKCPFNKKCEINPVTRRFCQLCRLIKCFEIGMRKEYIMSEDDKREKWKKIEKNRATKRRGAEEECCGEEVPPGEPKRKQGRPETENEDEGYDEEEGSSGGGGQDDPKKSQKPVKWNLRNMASTSKNTYLKGRQKSNSSGEQSNPFPSPELPPPSSPETETVTESRTCDVFEEVRTPTRTNQSRSVEIYQVSRSTEEKKVSMEEKEKTYADSNIIKIILDSEFSEPSEVYTNSMVGRRSVEEEEKTCNFQEGRPVSDSDVLDFASNSRNILAEYTKEGKNFLVISKDALMRHQGTKNSSGSQELGSSGMEGKDGKSSLLSSLMNRRRSSDSATSPVRKNMTEDIFQDIPRTSSLCMTNSIDSILSEAIKLEYEAYTSMNSRMNSRELNDAERAKLNELIVANKALLAPLEDDLSGDDYGFNAIFGCGPSVLVDVLNLTAVAIRRLIKMSKKINAFKNMCQDDQIALLKGGCTEMMILRSAMTYDPDRDSWKIPQSKEKLMNIKVDILKEAGGRVFEEHQRFLQTFDPKWRNDENIMIILSAIALFTPDRPRVVHYDVIKLEQNSYYYLLRRYLESIYQGCEARLTFLKLIHKISELHKLNEDHVRVYLDANPREIEPLLIEIFDLKPH